MYKCSSVEIHTGSTRVAEKLKIYESQRDLCELQWLNTFAVDNLCELESL